MEYQHLKCETTIIAGLQIPIFYTAGLQIRPNKRSNPSGGVDVAAKEASPRGGLEGVLGSFGGGFGIILQ